MIQFNQLISQGRQLVILDELIIDIKSYIANHPGGQKVLQGNIGRDISKFFYGGYQYENLKGQKDLHTHSKDALALCSQMVIGSIEKNHGDEYQVKLHESSSFNKSHTKTFIFKGEQKRQGLQKYYSDVQMIGKHFLVHHNKKHAVKRHYTICNCLEPNAYD